MSEPLDREPELIHRFKNHLAIVVSFADLLMLEMAEDDPHRADVEEIHRASRAALALLPQLDKMS
jgi:two-component sensor histidine kinase